MQKAEEQLMLQMWKIVADFIIKSVLKVTHRIAHMRSDRSIIL